MSQVRINASIPAGDLEVIVPLHLTMADSGTAQLRDALLEASNRILRAYGKDEIKHHEESKQQPEPKPSSRGAHHLTENANADPICHCGWDPARETFPVVRSREQARNDIRMHIADTKGAQ